MTYNRYIHSLDCLSRKWLWQFLQQHPIHFNKSLLQLLIVVFISMTSTAAYACSCSHSEPEEYPYNSLIFKGTAIAIDDEKKQGQPTGRKQAKFKVAVSYKGSDANEVIVTYVQADGVGCGWGFTVGKEVTVFANGNRQDGFSTSMCTMMPYVSTISQGDMTIQKSIEKYRAKREALHKASKTVKQLREQAAFFVKYNDYEEAESVFNQLLHKHPKDLNSLIGRAELRYGAKYYESSLADYRAAIRLNNHNQSAKRGKTLSLLKLGRMNELTKDDRDFSGYNGRDDAETDFKSSFAGLDLVGANFRNTSFNGVDFSGADLRDADFTEADLMRCNFSGAKLSHTKFHKFSSYEAVFKNATLQSTDFTEADLRFANFENASLDEADFSKAKFEKALFKGSSTKQTKFSNVVFYGTKLQGMTFVGNDFSGADFRDADLRDSTFQNANLSGAIFGAYLYNLTDLRGTNLASATLTGVKWDDALVNCHTQLPVNYTIASLPVFPLWTGCEGVPPKTALDVHKLHLQEIDAPNSDFAEMNLSDSRFMSVRFDNSDFSHATLTKSEINGGSCLNANFSYADLTKSHLYRVNFTGASFTHANLSEAYLIGVDFSEANLEDAILTGLEFDDKTKWPAGFDPIAAGAKKR